MTTRSEWRASANRQQELNARFALLREWLRSVGATCLWQQRVPRVGMVECWTANGRIFMLQTYVKGAGWEIYIPASGSNKTTTTLDAVSRYLRGESNG